LSKEKGQTMTHKTQIEQHKPH